MLTDAVRGGMLVEPPLIEKGDIAENDSCNSVDRKLEIGLCQPATYLIN